MNIEQLIREVRRAEQAGKIAFTADGTLMVLPYANLTLGGVFTSSVRRHVQVQKSIEMGDPEREAWFRHQLFASGAVHGDVGYERMMEDTSHNLIPDAGITAMLDILFRTAVSKKSNWYQGPFKTSVTPAAGWLSNWSGSGGAAPASELVPTTDYTVSARPEAVFAAASAKSIACAATSFTMSAGTSGITLYGSTLNSVATAAYNVTDQILAAATSFATAKSGLGAADKVDITYTLSGASS